MRASTSITSYVSAMPILATGVFDAWGLSLTHTLVLIAFLLIVIDIFFESDILTHVGYVLLCVALVRILPVHLLYKVLIGLAAWFALVGFHYLAWKHLTHGLINRWFAPDKVKTGAEGLVGLTGEIKEIEGVRLIKVRGDLWPYQAAAPLQPGERATIVAAKDGVLRVEPMAKES